MTDPENTMFAFSAIQHEPRFSDLDPAAKMTWLGVLHLASTSPRPGHLFRGDGTPVDRTDVARAAGVTDPIPALRTFLQRGLLQRVNGHVEVSNWSSWNPRLTSPEPRGNLSKLQEEEGESGGGGGGVSGGVDAVEAKLSTHHPLTTTIPNEYNVGTGPAGGDELRSSSVTGRGFLGSVTTDVTGPSPTQPADRPEPRGVVRGGGVHGTERAAPALSSRTPKTANFAVIVENNDPRVPKPHKTVIRKKPARDQTLERVLGLDYKGRAVEFPSMHHAVTDALGLAFNACSDPDWTRCAKAASILVKAMPPVTREEVPVLIRNWSVVFPGAICTETAIAKWIGKLRQGEAPPERPSKKNEPKGYEGLRAHFADLDPRRMT